MYIVLNKTLSQALAIKSSVTKLNCIYRSHKAWTGRLCDLITLGIKYVLNSNSTFLDANVALKLTHADTVCLLNITRLHVDSLRLELYYVAY